MYFDTHAHYDDDSFDVDREEVLGTMREAGIGLIVDPGSNEKSSAFAVELSHKYDFVYAAVGWHPDGVNEFTDRSEELIRKWVQDPKVVAIGEIGLDYYYDDGLPRELQRRVFARQMELADELKMPVIVHDRDAHADSLAIVREHPGVRGVFHCYSGSPEIAQELINMGWYISFTGALTFKNARRAPETVAMCPMDRLMLETDSPYMAPVPHRGKRCDSKFLPFIAARMAEIKGISIEEVEKVTYENGKRFFSITE